MRLRRWLLIFAIAAAQFAVFEVALQWLKDHLPAPATPTLVHGGHGDPVHDFEELFNRYFRAIRERQAAVIGLLPKAGATAWQIARQMFPETDDVHRFLSVSEAVAHLDLAHSERKIQVELGDGREVYRKLSD